MSVQLVEKTSTYSNVASATTTIAKTPFGIEDILYISNNNNNNNPQSINKNHQFDKNIPSAAKNGIKIGESEEIKKISASER